MRQSLREYVTLVNKEYAKELRRRSGLPLRSQADLVIQRYSPSVFKKILKANRELIYKPVKH